MSISNQQLAELLVGIAKANADMTRAAVGPNNFLHMQVLPAVQSAARIQQEQQATLSTLYARMLLLAVGGNTPDAKVYAGELDRLLGQ